MDITITTIHAKMKEVMNYLITATLQVFFSSSSTSINSSRIGTRPGLRKGIYVKQLSTCKSLLGWDEAK